MYNIEETLTVFLIGLHVGNFLLNTGRYRKAIELLKECLLFLNNKAVRVGNVWFLGIIYMSLSRAYLNASDPTEAMRHVERAVALFMEMDEWKEGNDLCTTAVRVYRFLAEFVKAKYLHEKALAIGIGIGDIKKAETVNGNLGMVYASLEDFVKAKECLEKSLRISIETGNRERAREHCDNLGNLCHCLGDYVKAKQFIENAIVISIEIGDREGEGLGYGKLGAVYRRVGDYVKAREFLEKALALSIENGDRENESAHCGNLGTLYQALNDYANAKQFNEKALEISIEIGNRKGEGVHCGNLGTVYQSIGDFLKAKEFVEKGLAISMEIGDREAEGALYGNLGSVYHYLGDYLKAKEYHEKALAVNIEIGDRQGEEVNYDNLGSVFRHLGDYGKARDFLEKALTISIEICNRIGEGTHYGNLGTVYQSLCDYARAEEYYEKALAISTEVGDSKKEEAHYGNLGSLNLSLCNYFKAKYYLEKALAISLEIGDREGEGVHYGNLGTMFRAHGDYLKAKAFYEKALAINIEIGDRHGEGTQYHNLGSVYYLLYDYVMAKEFLEKALTISIETGSRKGVEADYCNLGNVCRSLGDYVKAKEYYEKGLAISVEIGDKDGEGAHCSNLGLVYQALRDYLKAKKFHERALAISIEIGNRGALGTHYGNLGTVCCYLDDDERAEQLYMKGLAIASELGSSNEEFTIYCFLALLYVSKKEMDKAFSCLFAAIDRFEKLRGFLGKHDQFKISFAEENCFPYNALVVMLCREGKIKEAMCVSELSRARALADIMSGQYSVKGLSTAYEPTLSGIQGITQIKGSTCLYTSFCFERIVYWIMKQNKKISFREIEKDAFAEIRNSAKLSLQDWVETLANQSYRNMRDLLRRECEDRSLSAFYETDARCGAQAQAGEEQEQEPALSLLYKLVISPVADLFEGSEIIIAPERSLYKVPFAALLDENGKHLSETFRIRLIPSLTTLRIIQDSPADYHRETGVLIVGDPDVGLRRICPLPSAREEARMIGQLLGVRPFLRREATKQVVLQGMQSVSLIHIAAHGDAQRGEIALAPVRPTRKVLLKEDFMLTMSDISEVKLRAKLVVLSCCHSFRGEISTEGVVGIARAFLGSGARSVLVSLWAVEDKATKAFMCQFYKHLSRGESASECLHEAMKWMMGCPQFCAVNQWAPFVLVGDNVAFDFEKLNGLITSSVGCYVGELVAAGQDHYLRDGLQAELEQWFQGL